MTKRFAAYFRLAVVLAIGWSAAAAPRFAPAQEAASSPEAINAYSDAANLFNGREYELARTKWEEFLKQHGKDPLAPRAQHYLGVCQLQLKQHQKAADTFAAVIKNYPKFEFLEESYFNLGLAQYTLGVAGTAGMLDQAVATFANEYKLFPKGKGKLADQCAYQWGEALYAQQKYAEAATAYDLVVKEFPESKLRADALYALGVTREELSQFPQAGAAYDLFLKEFDKHALATEVKMRKARTLMETGEVKTAEKMFAEVAAVPGFKDADYALLKQAFCVAKQDRFAEAAALYASIEKVNPQSANLPEAILAAGRSFYRAEKFEEAATWFQKAISLNNAGSPEAAHWLCRIQLRNKKPAEALMLATQWIPAAAQSPYLVNLKVDQADASFDIPEKRAESRELYAKIASEHPQSELAPQALYNAAFAALETKQFDKGLEHAAAFAKIFPQDKLLPDAKFVSAECLLLQKKYPEAEAAYKALVASFPQSGEVATWQVREGLCQYLQKKYADVVAGLGKAVAAIKKPELLAEAEHYIAASLFFTDKFAEAVPWFEAALKAAPKSAKADETLLLYSRTQRKLDKNAEAKATINKLITEFPNSEVLDQGYYRLGEYCFAANEFPAAVQAYDQVIAKFPESAYAPYALYGKGWAELKAKEFAQAAASFGEVLTKFKDHSLTADAYFGRAMARRQAGEFQGAVEDVDAYLKLMPDVNQRPDALYEKALAQVALKDHAGAAATLNVILKEHEKYPATDKVLYELGWALKSQDKNAEAAAAFQKLASGYPESSFAPEAWFHVGEEQYEQKNYAEAAKAYAAAKAKVAKGDLGEQVLYKLGFAQYLQKNYAEAVKEFTQQITDYNAGRLHADGFFMRAESLFKQDNFKDALPAFKDAAKTKASSPTIENLICLHGGQSAAQLKQWPDSISLLTTLLTKFPDSPYLAEANYELGWALQNSGKPDEALKHYEVAATKSRDQLGARARFMMGEIYFEKKLFSEAIKEFKLAMYGYGGEQAPAETQNWQARAGYEAGRCAEVQITAASADAKAALVSEAKKAYGFVVEKHAEHQLAGEARKRLEALAKL
jgi:TolA-binding protein